MLNILTNLDDIDKFVFKVIQDMKFEPVPDNPESKAMGVTHKAQTQLYVPYWIEDETLRMRYLERMRSFVNEAVNNAAVMASEIYVDAYTDTTMPEDVMKPFMRILEAMVSNKVPYLNMLKEILDVGSVDDLTRMVAISISFPLFKDNFGRKELRNPIVGWYVSSHAVTRVEGIEGEWQGIYKIEDNYTLEAMDKLDKS